MGINTHYYTFYGVKLDYNPFGKTDEESEDFLERLYDKTSDYNFISDTMDSRYLLIGKILFDSGDLRWNDFEDSWVDIDISSLSEIDSQWRNGFREDFPEYAYLIDNTPSTLTTFVHYS